MYPQVPICAKDLTCGNPAHPISYSTNYSCGSCAAGTNCEKCFNVMTNGPGVNSSSTCLGDSCVGGLSTATTIVSQCPHGFDQLGQKCLCCVTTQEISRFCTSNSDPLAQSAVTNWLMKANLKAKNLIFFTFVLLFTLGMIF